MKSQIFDNASPELISHACMNLSSHVVLEGETIVEQGEYPDSLIFLKSGTCEVIKIRYPGEEEVLIKTKRSMKPRARKITQPEEIRLAILLEGSSFGEVALITGEKRTASIRALTPIHFFSLSAEVFYQLIDEFDDFRKAVLQLACELGGGGGGWGGGGVEGDGGCRSTQLT